jgi:Flp pilus assembly pilin Flp
MISVAVSTSLRFLSGTCLHRMSKGVTMMLLKSQKGQTAVEYALIAIVLLAIVASAVAQPMKDAMKTAFNTVKTKSNSITVTTT